MTASLTIDGAARILRKAPVVLLLIVAETAQAQTQPELPFLSDNRFGAVRLIGALLAATLVPLLIDRVARKSKRVLR